MAKEKAKAKVKAEEVDVLKAELEKAQAELAEMKKQYKPEVKPSGALWMRPNGEGYDTKFVNENNPKLVERAKEAGFLPEAEALAKAKA